MHKRSGMAQCMRLGLLVVALGAGSAMADDYAPVNQLLRSGQFAEAMQKADQYLAKNPRDPQMRFLKGLIQQDSGKQADAIVTYTRLIEEYPELPEPYNNVAVLYANLGQYDKARDALEKAIRGSRGYAIAHENLGDVYARLASQSYAQALQLDGGNTTIPPKLALMRQLTSRSAADRTAPAQAPAPATPDRARLPAPSASSAR